MTYESWRISYQSSEQAARAAFNELSALRGESQKVVAAFEALGETKGIGEQMTRHQQCEAALIRLKNALRSNARDKPCHEVASA